MIIDCNVAVVDVRDVAKAHIECVEKIEETRNKRYIVSNNTFNSKDVLNILREEFS